MKHWWRLKTVTRVLCCRKYMEYALEYVHFCIEDNDVLVTAAYVEVLKEGESQLKVIAKALSIWGEEGFFTIWRTTATKQKRHGK